MGYVKVGGWSDGKPDHIIRGSLLCEPEKRKPDQAGLFKSTGLVTHTHMHMYVPKIG